jgi:hypothetical protein
MRITIVILIHIKVAYIPPCKNAGHINLSPSRNICITQQRRTLLRHITRLLTAGKVWAPAPAQSTASPDDTGSLTAPPSRLRLAAAGRSYRDTPDHDQVGVLDIDLDCAHGARGRQPAGAGPAHVLLAEVDGGCLAVATRPGRWLLRRDAQVQQVTRHLLDSETPLRTLGGHVLASADGQWLCTTETDTRDGSG